MSRDPDWCVGTARPLTPRARAPCALPRARRTRARTDEPPSASLPQPLLIAYLNGCKLHKFTSVRVLAAKFVATTLACASGLCCGPEGPIIHMGACIGKQALRVLYHLEHAPPRAVFSALGNLDRDEDKGVFAAIGAGAGVAAAFNAPLSGTLFVVEEAASHFSLTLLWRAFSAAMVCAAFSAQR